MLKSTSIVLVCLVVGLIQLAYCSDESYSYFDDFLVNLELQGNFITDDNENMDGSGDAADSLSTTPKFDLPIRTGFAKSKEVACCSLGNLAGDKGYHCIAKFYAARTILRNQNRVHNRKMGFHGENADPSYGAKMMRTFEQCVASRGRVFQKCCEMAASQKRAKPHFDSIRRKKWYEMKMKRIVVPKKMQVEDNVVGV